MSDAHPQAALLLLAATSLWALGPAAAEPNNPNTDWFSKAGYGVFVHYLAGLQNNAGAVNSLGKETFWDQCVREFDVQRFADNMARAGAGYVIFTIMQRSRFLIAPNATFDRITGYKPGEACATRDLVADLYQALHARGIPLMLYFTGDGPCDDPKAAAAFGCTYPTNTGCVRKWASVAREYGERYGDKVLGYWCDGCYPFFGYDDEKLGIMAEGLKAGSPLRIVALNVGVQDRVHAYTRHEDFTTGEQNSFLDRPLARWVDGEQWHLLSFLGTGWAQPGVRYSKQQMIEYVAEVNRYGGVVSIDVMLYRDGDLDRSQLEVLRALRPGLAAYKAPTPIPPGNLAYRKPARLLSLDGSHDLEVNSGVHFPGLGVDGDLSTTALAGGEWPWTYQVDLLAIRAVTRVKVTFGTGYATHFQVLVSEDGKAWTKVAEAANHDGSPYQASFAPTKGRLVRLSALKPDGPGQKGVQMSVAELEVYE